jgi:hypothetical protein
MLKVAFIAPNMADYLADSVLHGLRSLLDDQVVDYPKAERLYQDCGESTWRQIRGCGFTLYGLLENIEIDRDGIVQKILAREFDLVIFGEIYEDYKLFQQLASRLDARKVALLDGADAQSMYAYAGKWWRPPACWFLAWPERFLYFKRELTPLTLRYRSYLLLPEWLCERMTPPGNMRRIAFSIPEEKIVRELPVKQKLFGIHVVDEEVACRLPGAKTAGAFTTEEGYYTDLQASRFAITTKRAGWDCLRHYEIAANACVPCFRQLDRKPASCAPHGLDSSNCVIYQNYDDLMRQIESIDDQRYAELQSGALAWVRANTTVERARHLLAAIDPELLSRLPSNGH